MNIIKLFINAILAEKCDDFRSHFIYNLLYR